MRHALSFAKDLGFFDLVAESDSLNVVQAIRSDSQLPTHFGMVIADCNSLSSLFSNFF